ncbi:MAG: hypothetical protein FK733_13095 [Asgard group archaeon]|nr:hypothetical protein [Asgard group archaeon]
MKPISLCLIQMGDKGLELVRAFPDVVPSHTLTEIITKSMPMGAKDGDFTSNVIGEKNAFSGYVFAIPSTIGRSNIASICAIFDNSSYDVNSVRKIFSLIINEMKKYDVIKTDILYKILPTLFKSFESDKITIKISSVVTIEIDNTGRDEPVEPLKKSVNNFESDMWK